MSVSLAKAAPQATPALVPDALAILVLALLLSLQPITTDLYLPALPALTRSLDASVAAAQMTLSALLLAFGCSQMAWGPLSDRFGRRPILLAGLSLYTLASAGSALSASISLLITWRVVQGVALGAVVMCARAILRDLYAPEAGARAMSKALTGLGIAACLCAPLGGLLTEWLGWRAALLALTAYAVLTLSVVALRLPETLAHPNPLALQPATILRTWKQVLRHPTFWAFSLQTTFTYCGLISFLAASPFVFIEVLGCSRAEYGLLMASTGVAYFLGTFLCRFALGRMGLRRTVALGGALSLLGGMGLLAAALAGWTHPWALLLPFYPYMLGHGIHQSCGQSGAVGPFPRAAGVASALNGVMMMLMAFAIGGWLGRNLNGTIWPLIHSVALWSVVLALVSWTLVQKFGEPHDQ